ncbi:MAG: hypothetical protein VKL58_09150 [Cyanobacteriota bacterium]|nr:hypothetical protein [Cyanobacteriota bacterium]
MRSWVQEHQGIVEGAQELSGPGHGLFVGDGIGPEALQAQLGLQGAQAFRAGVQLGQERIGTRSGRIQQRWIHPLIMVDQRIAGGRQDHSKSADFSAETRGFCRWGAVKIK